MATILIPGDQHLANFNKPRCSRHNLLFPYRPPFIDRFSVPKLGNIMQGVSVWKPFKYKFDLIHSFNEVPITNKPWIGTFESYVPRTIGKNDNNRKKMVRKLILRDNCIKLILLSKYGAKQSEYWNQGWTDLPKMTRKIEVIHPTVPLRNSTPKQHNGQRIRLVFCGRIFAQKGGIVALRLAKLAHETNFPLQVELISSMQSGWTDVTDKSHYDPDLKLLNLPNVTLYDELPNHLVIDLFRECDFHILPTLHDTYGYSVLEALSVGTPAIVTATCALPEIIQHKENGFLLNVDVDELNEIRWLGIKSDIWNRMTNGLRLTHDYWEQQNQTFNDLAEQAFNVLQSFLVEPADYERLSCNAINQIANFHSPEITSRHLDTIYDNILNAN